MSPDNLALQMIAQLRLALQRPLPVDVTTVHTDVFEKLPRTHRAAARQRYVEGVDRIIDTPQQWPTDWESLSIEQLALHLGGPHGPGGAERDLDEPIAPDTSARDLGGPRGPGGGEQDLTDGTDLDLSGPHGAGPGDLD